jgi:hypothetical protein
VKYYGTILQGFHAWKIGKMGYQTGVLQKKDKYKKKTVKIGCKLVEKTEKFQYSSIKNFGFFKGDQLEVLRARRIVHFQF